VPKKKADRENLVTMGLRLEPDVRQELESAGTAASIPVSRVIRAAVNHLLSLNDVEREKIIQQSEKTIFQKQQVEARYADWKKRYSPKVAVLNNSLQEQFNRECSELCKKFLERCFSVEAQA